MADKEKSENALQKEIDKIKETVESDENVRLRKIVQVFTHYNVLLNLATQTNADKVRKAFEELGPTFVKIGQILSVRTDIVSPAFALEFKKLQDNVTTNPFSSIKSIIESESGVKIDDLFEKVEKKPLASASIAQVHIAKLMNGQDVVLKVQHPGIEKSITLDLVLLEKAIPLIKHIHAAGMLNPAEMIAELKRSLMLELDFTNEAKNIDEFYQRNKDVPGIISPKVYKEYSTKRLLIMDCMQGMKISDYIEKANEEEKNGNKEYTAMKKRLADIIVTNYMKQIFDDGYFHADPHPGNLLVTNEDTKAEPTTPDEPMIVDFPNPNVLLFQTIDLFKHLGMTPPAEGAEKIIYLDFGMMGRLDESTLNKFNGIISAIFEKDSEKIARALMDLCKSTGETDMDKLTHDVNQVFARYYEMPIGEMDMPEIFGKVAGLCVSNHLLLPSNITLLFKGVGTIEGIVLALNPDLSIMTAIEPYAKRFLLKQHDWKKESLDYLKTTAHAIKLIPELPIKASKILDNLADGRTKIKMEVQDLDSAMQMLKAMVSRLSMSIVIAALIVGSSLLLNAAGAAGYHEPVAAIGFIGIAIAVVIAVISIVDHFKKRKR